MVVAGLAVPSSILAFSSDFHRAAAKRSFGHPVKSRGHGATWRKTEEVRETKSKPPRERRHPVCGGVEPGRAAWQASARSPRQGFAIGRHEPAARPSTSARGGRLNLRAPQRPATSGTCTLAATRLTPTCARRARQPADSKEEWSPYRQPAYYGGPSYSSLLPSAALTCLRMARRCSTQPLSSARMPEAAMPFRRCNWSEGSGSG